MPKKKNVVNEYEKDAPENLNGHPFYGFILDEHQKNFVDNIWNPEKLIIMCDSVAGSGKTQMSFAVANLLYEYGRYDGIIYIVSAYGEGKQGFLPGDITEKSEVYFEPLYQAMIKCGVVPYQAIYDDSMTAQNKNSSGYVKAMTDTYTRGTNFENKVIIIDEAQNCDFKQMKKILTRIADNCKVIVIGHRKQRDTEDRSNAFERYLDYYRSLDDDRVAICSLVKNYRGWISQSADALEME